MNRTGNITWDIWKWTCPKKDENESHCINNRALEQCKQRIRGFLIGNIFFSTKIMRKSEKISFMKLLHHCGLFWNVDVFLSGIFSIYINRLMREKVTFAYVQRREFFSLHSLYLFFSQRKALLFYKWHVHTKGCGKECSNNAQMFHCS